MGILAGAFERRATKKVAGHPGGIPDWFVQFLSGGGTHAGVAVSESTALNYSAVLACVLVLSESVASLPLMYYERLEPRGKRRAAEEPMFGLLHDAPNPEMDSFTFWQTFVAHTALWGNGYAEQVRKNGRLIELWPLTPWRVKMERVSDGPLKDQRMYRISLPDGGIKTLFQDQILHVPWMSLNGAEGLSPIKLSREAIALGLAAEGFGARFFGNDARPGVVLEHPATLDDEAHKRLRESWETRHQGLDKSHRIAILEEGMKLHQVGIPPEDAQFLETRKFQLTEIARIYRVPPHMIADLERSTFSNIEHQALEFVVHTLRPWLVRIERAIRQQLLLPRERQRFFAEFLVDGLLRGDSQARSEFYTKMFNIGAFSPNDILELENRNPVENGDQRFVPLNMVPLDQTAQALEPNQTGPDDDLDDVRTTRSLPPDDETRAQRSAASRRRLALAHRRLFRAAALRVVKREEADVIRQAVKFLRRRSETEFFAWLKSFYAEHGDFVRGNMTPIYETYLETIVAEVAEEVGTEAVVTPALRDFANRYIDAYIARHVGSSLGQLRNVVREAIAAGEDPVQALQARFDTWRETRPQRIAEAEAFRFNGAVTKTVFAAAGILRVRWVTFDKECPFCSEMDGRTIAVADFFAHEGEELNPPGAHAPLTIKSNIGHPPLHSGGCDCGITPG